MQSKIKLKPSLILQVAITLLISQSVLGNIKIPAVFSNHMVMQQNKKVMVWGWGNPGEKVTVQGSWLAKKESTTTGKDGRWKVQLKTTSAGGPFTILIAGENIIEIKDVMLGEVWIAQC